MKTISIRKLKYNSNEYIEELNLRNSILREPLGLDLYSEDLSQDARDIHIGAFDGKKLIGCLLLSIVNDKTLKMRQVAVNNSYQRLGTGSKMVAFAEKYAVEKGYGIMSMHARKVSLSFYSKLGYTQVGNEFTEVRVPHFEMIKELK